MEKFEHTQHGKPEIPSPEESGVRRIVETDEKAMFRKMAAKAEEVHPDDPWEEFGPKDEPDTAKVWGESEDLDAEDREHAKKLAERLADFDEATKHLPQDDLDKALEEMKKKRAS